MVAASLSPNAASSVMFVAVHGHNVPLFVAKCHKVEAASCSLDPGAASVLHSPRAAPRRRSPVPAHVTSAVIAGGGQAVTTGGATRTTRDEAVKEDVIRGGGGEGMSCGEEAMQRKTSGEEM